MKSASIVLSFIVRLFRVLWRFLVHYDYGFKVFRIKRFSLFFRIHGFLLKDLSYSYTDITLLPIVMFSVRRYKPFPKSAYKWDRTVFTFRWLFVNIWVSFISNK